MTRKFFSIALVVVLALALSVNAFAASPDKEGGGTGTPGIGGGSSSTPTEPTEPTEPSNPGTDGPVDSNGNALPVEDLTVTLPDETANLPAEEVAKVEAVTSQLNAAGGEADKLVQNAGAGVTAAVNNQLAGTGVTLSDMKVATTFNLTATGKIAETLANGGSIDVPFEGIPAAKKGMAAVAMHYASYGWEVLPATVIEDGVVLVKGITSLSPFVILVGEKASAPTTPTNPTSPTTPTTPTTPSTTVKSPQTSDVNLEGVVMLLGALSCAAAFAFCMKRSLKA